MFANQKTHYQWMTIYSHRDHILPKSREVKNTYSVNTATTAKLFSLFFQFFHHRQSSIIPSGDRVHNLIRPIGFVKSFLYLPGVFESGYVSYPSKLALRSNSFGIVGTWRNRAEWCATLWWSFARSPKWSRGIVFFIRSHIRWSIVN